MACTTKLWHDAGGFDFLGAMTSIAFPRVLCLMPISIGAAIVHHYGFDIMPGEGAVYAPSFELVCAVPSV